MEALKFLFRRYSNRLRPAKAAAYRGRQLRYEGLEGRELMAVFADPYFGASGKVLASVGSGATAYAIAEQSDGRLVVAGTNSAGSIVVRYKSDGTLDTSFDLDGSVVTSGISASGVAVQADGKIVIAGGSGGGGFGIARYNIDGSLDTSFDGDGKVSTAMAGASAYNVAVQNDGKIVISGAATESTRKFALARYNADGSLDTSFDNDGVVLTAMGTNDEADTILFTPDGKIVAGGYASTAAGTVLAVARYNADGSLDTTFDGDGKVTTSIKAFAFHIRMAAQSDGKIVVASGSNNPNFDFQLVRFNSDGSLDASFDGDGIVTTNILGNETAYGIAVQSDGKIVAAGSSTASATDFAVARYNTDGSLDTSFDSDGKFTVDMGAVSDIAYDLLLDEDGKITLAGIANSGGGVSSVALFRLTEPRPAISSFLIPEDAILNQPIQLSAAATHVAQESSTLTYQWAVSGPSGYQNFLSGNTAEFTPPVVGTYVVTLKVLDNIGTSTTRSDEVTVANAAPTLSSFSVPVQGNLSKAIPLSALATDLSQDAFTLTYQWTITGPNSFQSVISGNNISFVPPAEGTYTAALTVTDSGALSTSASADISVVNDAPSITGLVVPTHGLQNRRVVLGSSAYDPNQSAATLTYEWTITGPNGFSETPTGRNVSFIPPTPGTYAAALTVTDSGNLTATANDMFLVENVAPTIVGTSVPNQAFEGERIRLSSAASDLNQSTVSLSYSWSVTGPGFSQPLIGRNASFIAPDNGTYNVVLTVKDAGNLTDTISDSITVANVPPVIATYFVAATGKVNVAQKLSAVASDPAGAKDALIYTWLITGPSKYTKTLLGPTVTWIPPVVVGKYTVKLTVNDGDGGVAAKSSFVTIGR